MSRIRKSLLVHKKSFEYSNTPLNFLSKSKLHSFQFRSKWDLVQKSKPFGLKLIPLEYYSSQLPNPPSTDKEIKYCLSYLSPDDMEECRMIPDEAIVGWVTEVPHKDKEGNYQIPPESFIENESFVNMMHSTIRNYMRGNYPDDDISASIEALNGREDIQYWNNVTDDLEGEVTRPSTEHICGSVSLVDGHVIEYVPNFAFRLVTSKGVYELGKSLEEEIIRKLKDMCSRELETKESSS